MEQKSKLKKIESYIRKTEELQAKTEGVLKELSGMLIVSKGQSGLTITANGNMNIESIEIDSKYAEDLNKLSRDLVDCINDIIEKSRSAARERYSQVSKTLLG